MVEVLRRHSNNYGAVQRVDRLTRHLELKGRGQAPMPRPAYQPRKLSQRLSDDTVGGILAAYKAGATTREVGERFGLAHSSVEKNLRQHKVSARRRGLNADQVKRALELRDSGQSLQLIAAHLGFGMSTISRVLRRGSE